MNTYIDDIPVETARRAYNGVSFSPERRAEIERNGYAQEMAQDYADLQKLAIGKEGMQQVLDAEFERYREGYKARYLKKLYSDSRCMSWMITGPSNFPVRRMEKRNAAARKRLEETIAFRERALAAIRKTLCPELRPIMSGDGDAVERLTAKIAEAEALQEQFHAVNKAHKAYLKNTASLDSSPLAENLKTRIRNYKPTYSWEPHPIAPFEFTNNNANIRRMKERLVVISRNHAAPASQAEGTNARFEDCPSENRVRLFFAGKPSEEVRTRLKRGGFRWTPTLGCWQAYRHQHTVETAKQEAGLTA